MTWKPMMDPFSETTNSSSLHSSDPRLMAKTILAVHGDRRGSGGPRNFIKTNHNEDDEDSAVVDSGMDMSSSEASSAYDGDYASASELDGSDYSSESTRKALSASFVAAASASSSLMTSTSTMRKKKMKRKKGGGTTTRKTVAAATSSNSKTDEHRTPAEPTKATKARKRASTKKRAAEQQQQQQEPSDQQQDDNLELWHASTINAGFTMEDYTNTEGETDKETAETAARRTTRRKSKRATSKDRNRSTRNSSTRTSDTETTNTAAAPAEKKKEKSVIESAQLDYEWWHTSSIQAGASMIEDYTNTEGETDKETSRRAARQKPKRTHSQDRNRSTRSKRETNNTETAEVAPARKQTKEKAQDINPEDYEWWHASPIHNKGSTMEDYSNTEGETDKETATSRQKPKRASSQDRSRRSKSSRATDTATTQPSVPATEYPTGSVKQKSKAAKVKKDEEQPTDDLEKPSKSAAETKRRSSIKQKAPIKKGTSKIETNGKEQPYSKNIFDSKDDINSNSNSNNDDQSIAWEALAIKAPREDGPAVKANTATGNKGHKNREMMDALSKGNISALHASLSTIKTQQTSFSYDPNQGRRQRPNTKTTERRKTIDNTVSRTSTNDYTTTVGTKEPKTKPTRMKSHDNTRGDGRNLNHRMDALSKGNNMNAFHASVSTLQTQQTSFSLDVNHGRNRSPDTRQKLAAQRRKTIDTTVSQPNTTATKATKAKPRRMKSHDPSGDDDNDFLTKTNNAKTIRRTKSDPDPGGPKRTRTPSRSRRPPPKTMDPTSKLQRSNSLSLVETNNSSVSNINKARRRQGTTTDYQNNTMDQSSQSMPSKEPRGRRASAGPKSFHIRTKSNESSSQLSFTNAKKMVGKGVDVKDSTASARKQKPGAKRTASKANAHSDVMSEDESIRSTSMSLDGGSLLSGHIAKDSQGHNNLHPLAGEHKRAGDPISPFSMRADSVDEFAGENDDDDVYSKSEASTIFSSSTSSLAKPANRRESLSKRNNKAGLRGSQHNVISAYFVRDDESGTDNENDIFARKAGDSVSGSLAGSLLSDYSSNGLGSRRFNGPMANSSSELSYDTTKTGWTAPKVISPFSFHASKQESDHTVPASTDHTSSPLIPDSDDEEEDDSSFHMDVPAPISSIVADAPPTPVAEQKESVPAKEEAKKVPPSKKDDPTKKKDTKKAEIPIQGPVAIKGPVIDPKKKGKEKQAPKAMPAAHLDDLDFDDPIPSEMNVKAKPKPKPKPSLWDSLCCCSVAAVAS